jgi:uncharacterized protein
MESLKAPPGDWKCGVLISRIPKTGELYQDSFELELGSPIAHWGQEYSPRGPVSAKAEFTYANERILANVSARAGFSLPCSRCLTETDIEISGNLRYLFTLRPLKDAKGVEDEETPDEDGDVDVIHVDSFQAELDMAPYVWEVLLLYLPERALCSEGCKGLCPLCGRNRNEGDCGCSEDNLDPRLAALRDIDV